MAKDFAKSRQSSRSKNGKKPTTRKKTSSSRRSSAKKQSQGGWRLFIGGVVTGIFLSFLFYLGTLPPEEKPQLAQTPSSPPESDPQPKPPKPRFDFYTMLPEQTLEVEARPSNVDPASDVGSPQATLEKYLLQTGSFRGQEDADRRRAELLLLGLEPSIEEATGDNGRWFRVYLGPYESRSAMSHARSLTAQQGIDTLLLKRNSP